MRVECKFLIECDAEYFRSFSSWDVAVEDGESGLEV